MLLAPILLFIWSFILCSANPFHKYPFVFLLDVGNEELGKANTDQIKVTVPGGTLALKYPATDTGKLIGHVRVTGIDFGTDLKATIVEGGPGFRYVVLLLTGAPGMQYDTVITIQTLEDEVEDTSNTKTENNYKVREDDSNDSAEEFSDGSQINSVYSEKSSADVSQLNFRYEETHSQDEDDEDSPRDNSHSATQDDINIENINNLSESSQKLETESILEEENIENDDDLAGDNDEGYDENNNNLDSEDTQLIDDIDRVKKQTLPTFDRRFVSLIPIDMLAGYGNYVPLQPYLNNDVLIYPQVAARPFQDIRENIRLENSDFTAKDFNNNINLLQRY